MINAWINGNNKKRPNMKLSASKFNEKNVFRQFQKNIYFSQMSAVRTGVRAYTDATPLTSKIYLNLAQISAVVESHLERKHYRLKFCLNYRSG